MRCPVCFHNDHMNTRCYQEVCSCHTAMGQNPPRPTEGKHDEFNSLSQAKGSIGYDGVLWRVNFHAKLLATLEEILLQLQRVVLVSQLCVMDGCLCDNHKQEQLDKLKKLSRGSR